MSFHFMFKNFKNSFAESVMSSIPAAVKESVEQIRASEEAVLVKVEKITETLVAAGLAYRQTITPKEILVHPANRAGQMLSASDTWEKGMRLWQVGLRLPLLSDSICFEVANDPVKREEQLRKNKVLVEQNAGVLAPVTSQERFLSVSCSHRCAWLRAIAAACHGPAGEQVQLRKGDDRSDGIRLALDVGWQWLVVSSSVELACPFLADFFQRAMNAGNSNAKQLSEIECAAQIATQIMHGMSVDAAIAAVAACDPACKTSLDVIGAYVSWYGGAEHMVLIDFLSKFSNLAALIQSCQAAAVAILLCFQAILAFFVQAILAVMVQAMHGCMSSSHFGCIFSSPIHGCSVIKPLWLSSFKPLWLHWQAVATTMAEASCSPPS